MSSILRILHCIPPGFHFSLQSMHFYPELIISLPIDNIFQGSYQKMEPKRIVGVGAPVVDHLTFVDEMKGENGGMVAISLEELNETLPKYTWKQVTGGSCTNTLKGLKSLGNDTYLIGKIGTDAAGDYFKTNIGFPTQLINGSDPTAQCLAFVTPNGDRTFRTFLGASVQLKAADLNPKYFENADLVHLEGYTLNADLVTEKVGDFIQSPLSFDLGSFEMVNQHKDRIFPFLKESVDILFCNELEAQALTGLVAKEAALKFLDYVPLAVVTCKEKGGYIGYQGKIQKFDAFPVKPIDSTGAGDLFASGFLHAYLQEKPLLECARLGALVGHDIVQVIGTELPQENWDKIRLS